jgi:hypothetical protein
VIPGQIVGLELRHRQHARVEDRIRQAKASGLRNLLCRGREENSNSYAGVTIPNAIRFETSAAILVTVRGWDITGNRFGGSPKRDEPDVFTNAIEISPRGVGVKGIRINFNNFSRCSNQIFWTAGTGGAYCAPPMAIGNDGDGVPHKIDPGSNLDNIRVG